jgi:phosphopantetheine adenylyltransferase
MIAVYAGTFDPITQSVTELVGALAPFAPERSKVLVERIGRLSALAPASRIR